MILLITSVFTVFLSLSLIHKHEIEFIKCALTIEKKTITFSLRLFPLNDLV